MLSGWEKLLPQIVSLGEINRRERSEREKEERKDERRKQVFTLLQELKPHINPFRGLLGELGFDPSQPLDACEDDSTFLKSLVDYPFPNYATVLEMPCLDDVNNLELSADEVKGLFDKHRVEIELMIAEWRNQGEQRLVDWWKAKNGSASGDITVSCFAYRI